MKSRLYAAIGAAIFVSACSDGVPNVEDPHNIVVNGIHMTQAEFLETYCTGKSNNETCGKVVIAKHKDSTRGVMPKW